jgi:hypothetical protein
MTNVEWATKVKLVTELEAKIGQLIAWTHTHGTALCPPKVDTYGDGMRDAKQQVSRILNETEQQS